MSGAGGGGGYEVEVWKSVLAGESRRGIGEVGRGAAVLAGRGEGWKGGGAVECLVALRGDGGGGR